MRLLLILFLAGLAYANTLRYFVGAGINFASPKLEINVRGLDGYKKIGDLGSRSYVASLTGGVQQYWDRDSYVGGRAMGEFGIGGASVEGSMAGVFTLSGALDLLVDVIKQDAVDLGIFGGFEYGMTFLVSESRAKGYKLKSDTYGAYGRVGVSLIAETIHRLDLTYKIPISPLALPTETIGKETRHHVYSGGQFCLGYKLLF